MAETHSYLHTLTGRIAVLTEDAASVFENFLVRVADDAKEYEPEMFQGGTVAEFLKDHPGLSRTKVENRDPAVKDDAAADSSAIPTGTPETTPSTEATAEPAPEATQTSTEDSTTTSEGN